MLTKSIKEIKERTVQQVIDKALHVYPEYLIENVDFPIKFNITEFNLEFFEFYREVDPEADIQDIFKIIENNMLKIKSFLFAKKLVLVLSNVPVDRLHDGTIEEENSYSLINQYSRILKIVSCPCFSDVDVSCVRDNFNKLKENGLKQALSYAKELKIESPCFSNLHSTIKDYKL